MSNRRESVLCKGWDLTVRPCVGPVFGGLGRSETPRCICVPPLPSPLLRLEMKLSHGITPHTRIVAFGGTRLTRGFVGFKLDDMAVKQVWLCTQKASDAGTWLDQSASGIPAHASSPSRRNYLVWVAVRLLVRVSPSRGGRKICLPRCLKGGKGGEATPPRTVSVSLEVLDLRQAQPKRLVSLSGQTHPHTSHGPLPSFYIRLSS
ncbi:hypothetical protein LZ30DRAFT_304707 [Colletotrichum cereale]|nr:hypothetical protein LZ30DRAFT_304707 [Colletotrichum cereale]